jgi:hypothetical protein
MRRILTHALSVYIGAGLFAGLLMKAAVPAINWIGVAYIAATWPVQIYCAPIRRECEVEPPDWAFSFGGTP